MKRWLLAVIMLAAITTLLTADMTLTPKNMSSQGVGTNQHASIRHRTVTANDTALGDDTRTWGDIGSVFHQIPTEWSHLQIKYYAYGDGTGAGSPDGGTFDIAVYVAQQYGCAELVYTVNDATVGAMQLSHEPWGGTAIVSGAADLNSCWVDTATVVEDWGTAVKASGEDGSDNCFTTTFDALGRAGVYVIITDMSNVTSVTYVISGFGG